MKKERFAEIALHLLSAATLYFVGARLLALQAPYPAFSPSFSTTEQLEAGGINMLMAAVLLVPVVIYQVVAHGLRRHRFWAWVAALCVLGAHAVSVYLPVAAFGIWGLVSRSTREVFGIQLQHEGSRTT